MIMIISEDEFVKGRYMYKNEPWDFPIEELDYLLEEHNGEIFKLVGDRLEEVEAFWFENLRLNFNLIFWNQNQISIINLWF